jgi:hypothetical protein
MYTQLLIDLYRRRELKLYPSLKRDKTLAVSYFRCTVFHSCHNFIGLPSSIPLKKNVSAYRETEFAEFFAKKCSCSCK